MNGLLIQADQLDITTTLPEKFHSMPATPFEHGTAPDERHHPGRVMHEPQQNKNTDRFHKDSGWTCYNLLVQLIVTANFDAKIIK